MAVTGSWTGAGAVEMAQGGCAWKASGGAAIKVALFTSAGSAQFGADAEDTLNLYSSLTNEVANGNGYTTGGAALTLIDAAYTSGTNTIALDANDVTWTSSTISAAYAVIYDSGDSKILGWIDFGATMSSSNGDFKITWASTGVLKMVVS